MELELQEAPERFYFTKGKKKKKRLFSKKKPNKPPLCRAALSWAGVGYGGMGWGFPCQ